MFEDVDLVTAESSSQVINDLLRLRDELTKARKEVEDLKTEKVRLELENNDLQSKLCEAEGREEKEQSKGKKLEDEIFSLRKQLKDYSSEETLTKSQSKEDAARQKQAFTEIKKQLFKQLVEEQQKNKQLETELSVLRSKLETPVMQSSNEAASALRVLGFCAKTDVEEKASEDSSKKVNTVDDSVSTEGKTSPTGHNFSQAPKKLVATSTDVLESSAKQSESGLLRQNQVQEKLNAKTQECEDLREEMLRLQERLSNMSASYDQLLIKSDEIRSSNNKTETTLKKTEADLQESKSRLASNQEDIQTLKEELSSTSLEARQRELKLNNKLSTAETEMKKALLKKDIEIESLKTQYNKEISNLKNDNEKTNATHAQKADKLTSELNFLRTSVNNQKLEHEKMSLMVANWKEKLSDTNDKEVGLEQRKKCLEKEKKTLIKEIVRLRENTTVLETKVCSEQELKEQLEDKINHLQEDHMKLSEEMQIVQTDRAKYKNLYTKVVKEREAAVDYHESTMKELKTKIKAALDVGQGILMTIDNMKLEKLRCSTPGMKDIQRLQWANTEIQKSVMPTIRKQMSAEEERDSTTKFTKTVMGNMLLAICQTLMHSNIILLKVAEA